MHSIKTKFIVAISILIVILFTLSSFLFLSEKQSEFTKDIFDNARSFAELTASNIVSDLSLYLPQESFVYFNREIKDTFEKFGDLDKLQIISFEGEIAYDSETENEAQYVGPERLIDDLVMGLQLKSINPSVKTLDSDRVVYLMTNDDGSLLYVDENETPVTPLSSDEKIEYMVQSGSNAHSVVYYLSYASLQERLVQTVIRGALLAVFGVGVGIILAYLFAVGITKPLKKLTDGVGNIAKGNFKHRVVVKTKDEISVLAGAFNKMAQELEISTKALVYKERVAKELEIAANIQKELLPKVIPDAKGMDISAGLLPAEEIGGDCYDFIKTDNDNLLMYLGDVTGHGVPSGIVVSIANALIYNYSNTTDIKDLLVKVNRIIKEKTSSNMFITLVMLHWDVAMNKLKYCSAGHEQMIHYHAKDGSVTLTPSGGLALGMLPNIEKNLVEEDVPMEEGDSIVIYSDGIPEAWKNETEMYGMEAFKRAVGEYGKLESALAIRNAIFSEVKEFAGSWKQMDDMTLMVLKRTDRDPTMNNGPAIPIQQVQENVDVQNSPESTSESVDVSDDDQQENTSSNIAEA